MKSCKNNSCSNIFCTLFPKLKVRANSPCKDYKFDASFNWLLKLDDEYYKDNFKSVLKTMKTIIHTISTQNANTLTKKQFDILKEIEMKFNEFENE